jgi:hypothetical protein
MKEEDLRLDKVDTAVVLIIVCGEAPLRTEHQ